MKYAINGMPAFRNADEYVVRSKDIHFYFRTIKRHIVRNK